MSILLSTIETKVRNLINDLVVTTTDQFIYTTSPTFTLFESNAILILEVSINGTSSGVSYTYNNSTQKVTITSELVAGDVVEIVYTCYQNYSSTEIKARIRSALYHISNCNLEDYEEESDESLYPEPTLREQNLIATITALLIEPNTDTIRLPDITINSPKSRPTIEKIREVIATFKNDNMGKFFVTNKYLE